MHDSLAAESLELALAHLGLDATLKFGGESYPIRVVPDEEYESYSAGDFEGTKSDKRVICRTSDVKGKTRNGLLILGGQTFRIERVTPSGDETELELVL